MLKKYYLTLALAGISCITYLRISDLRPTDSPAQVFKESKLDKRTRADLANQQNFQMTVDPDLGYIPRERLWKATNYLKQQQSFKEKAAISNINWTERGPNNVGGRTRAVMFDPNDNTHTKAFSASVGGGLWKTDNIYGSPVEWRAINDYFDNMAITTIAYNPINKDTMYFGTGEGYYNADAIAGDGIWKSVDGGETWSQLSATTGSAFSYIQKIVVDSNENIYASTRSGGVRRSTDHGTTWTKVLGSGVTASTNSSADIELASNGDLYAAMGIFAIDGIYKSTNSGTSWTKVYTSSGEQRIELACAPSDSNYVYMISQSSSTYAAAAVKRTTNAGSSWSTLSNPTDVFSANFCKSQAWYNLSMAVDPNDEDVVVMGGIDLYKTTNGGTSWTEISHWYGASSLPEVHSDQHTAVFAPNNSDTIMFGNDGGVYLSTNMSNSSPAFSHQVASYNVTQFYGCAMNPNALSNNFLAGSQDNGSHRYSDAGMNSTTEVTGGDGAYVHIDQDDPTYQFTSYVYNQYRRSTNSGSSFSSTGLNFSSSAGKFINPTDYDNNSQIMYCSWGNGQYMRWTNPRSGSSTTTVTFSASGTGEPSAIKADPNTANRIYIGTDDGEVWQIDDANGSITATDISPSGMSGHYVSCIAVEDGDASHLLATVSNYGVTSVYESTNTGSSWTSIEGNLPDMPVRWAIFSPIGGDSALLATELGVWTTDNINGGSTSWAASNDGMANVRTDMLQYRSSDSTVIAATHGRGLYSYSFTEIEAVDFQADDQVLHVGEEVKFTDLSTGATSWAWDFNNDGNTDATTKHPTWTFYEGGYKTVKLTINGTTTTTKSSYITVLPKLGIPYAVSDGGNFETNTWHFGSEALTGTNIWERGAPSNQLTTLNSSSYGWKTDLDGDCPDETIECYLYTPSFNMSAPGTYNLSFRKSMEWYYSNAPYCVIVEYSTSEGANWIKLGTSPDANGTNWYANTGISTLLQSDQIGFLEGATNENTEYDISSLAGNKDVRFRFTYISNSGFSSVGFVDGFMLDDFAISGPTNEGNAWDVETALNATATRYLGPNDTVNFVSANNKIIATVINLGTHDYGNTTATIDNEGNGTMDFDTNTLVSEKILEKTMIITPTTNNTSGSVKVTNYFTNTEASNWKSTTGWSYNDLNQLKSTVAITSATAANTINGASSLLDSSYAGNNLSLTSSYTNGFSGFGAGPMGPVLPVHLLSLSGKRYASETELNWTTATEINSSHFEIERMENNRFVKIGRLQSSGNSNSSINYTYIDDESEVQKRPFLTYRLKMLDRDGSYEYSKVLVLEKDLKVKVDVSPNPASNFIHVNINTHTQSPITIKVVNIEGKLMKQITTVVSANQLDIRDLPNGIYFVALYQRNSIIETKKITILD
jgi:PKD repeat protein